MANLSVEKLASVIGSAPELLLSQMQEAGLTHSNISDEVTDSDKKNLLDFLKNQQSKSNKTISLNNTKSKEIQKDSSSVSITRKRINKETTAKFEEKTKKTSTTIDFDGIERKRQAGETQNQVEEDRESKIMNKKL